MCMNVLSWQGTHPLAQGDKHLSHIQKRLLVAFYFSCVFWADDGLANCFWRERERMVVCFSLAERAVSQSSAL